MKTHQLGPKWLGKLLLFVAFLPPVFLFFAIQHSALTFPFWDHAELIRFFVKIKEGQFHFTDLFEAHNAHRPAVYRSVMLLNGVLTNWDIRSEFIYIILSIWASFAVHGFFIYRKLREQGYSFLFPLLFLSISLICFSPVGHNNHWWTMMFQLTSTHLFMLCSFLLAAQPPQKKSYQLGAGILSALAVFNFANGLLVLIAIPMMHVLNSLKTRLSLKTFILWCVGSSLIIAVYFTAFEPVQTGSGLNNSIKDLLDVLLFFFINIGAPLGGLLLFPYQSNFHLPTSIVFTTVNGLIGLFFVASGFFLIFQFIKKKIDTFPVRFFEVTFLFVLGSAAMTAWGRANFDSYGIFNANASRYTIYSSFLLYGYLYLLLEPRIYRHLAQLFDGKFRQRLLISLMGILLILAGTSYLRSLRVYHSAYHFNQVLAEAYSTKNPESELNTKIFPREDFVHFLKENLLKYNLGPYFDNLEK